MASLGAPVRVSPLIKTVRWGGLLLGLFYGSVHFNSLSKKENRRREEDAKYAEVRAAEQAAAKAAADKAELESLARAVGILSS